MTKLDIRDWADKKELHAAFVTENATVGYSSVASSV